jgi:hypothetical protein
MNIKSAIFVIALFGFGAGAAVQAGELTDVPQVSSVGSLTRAQVQADTAAWRMAGLADQSRGEQTPDIYAKHYKDELAAYTESLAGNAPLMAHNSDAPQG